jgi:hypothetical protein
VIATAGRDRQGEHPCPTVDVARGLLVVESWHPGRGYEKFERE